MRYRFFLWSGLLGVAGCLPQGDLVGAASSPGSNGSDAISQPTPGSGGGFGSGRTGTGGSSGGGSSGGGSGPSVNTCPAGTLRVADNYQASTTGNWCLVPNRYIGSDGTGGPYRASTAINLNNYSGWRKIPIKDPTVIRINGTYYMTGTWTKRCDLNSEYWSPYDNSFCTTIKNAGGAEIHSSMMAVKAPPNFPIFRSTNLIDWEYMGPAFTPMPWVDAGGVIPSDPPDGIHDLDEFPSPSNLGGTHKDEYLRLTGKIGGNSYRYRICRLEQPRFFMDPLDTSPNPRVYLSFSAVMNITQFTGSEPDTNDDYSEDDYCTNDDRRDRRYTSYYVVTSRDSFLSTHSFTDSLGDIVSPSDRKVIEQFFSTSEPGYLTTSVAINEPTTPPPPAQNFTGGWERHGAENLTANTTDAEKFRRYFVGTTFRPPAPEFPVNPADIFNVNLRNTGNTQYPAWRLSPTSGYEWHRFSQMLGSPSFFADPGSSGAVYVSYDWYQPPTDLFGSGTGGLNGWNTAIQRVARRTTGNIFFGMLVSSIAFTPASTDDTTRTNGLENLSLKPLTNGAGPTVSGLVEGCRSLDFDYSLTAGRVNCPGSFGSSLFYWPLVQRYFLTTSRNERKSGRVRLFSRSASQTGGLSSLWKTFNAKTGDHSWNTPDTSEVPLTSVETQAGNTAAGSRGAAYYGGHIFMGPGDRPYLVFTKQEEFDCASILAKGNFRMGGSCATFQSEMAALPHYLYDGTVYFKELTMAADQANLLQLVGPGVRSNYKAFGAASASNLQYFRIPKP